MAKQSTTPTAQRRDPLPVYCFQVTINSIASDPAVAFFKSVSGLKSESEVVDFQEGGENRFTHRLVGPTKWSNIVLKRGFSRDNALLEWRQAWALGTKRTRNSGKIVQLDTALKAVCTWEFIDGWPCKWELSEFDASKSELSIETLEIAHHGLKRV
ncbi:MAG: phage tail protein [Haliangiales bacterium]